MKALADKTTVVLAGAFNPAILLPQWVAVHGLGHPPGQEFQVEMLAPVGGGGQQRYSFDGLSYSAGFKQLTLHLGGGTEEQGNRAIVAVANILRQLPHTPVLGVGFNFAFSVEEPSPDFLGLMTTNDPLTESFPGDAEVVARNWGNVVKWGAALVHVECEFAGGQAIVGLNFHYATTSATHAEAILRGEHAFQTHRERAEAAAKALTGQVIEEQHVNKP